MAGTVGSVLARACMEAASKGGQLLSGPLTRTVDYVANRQVPNLVPDLSELISLYVHGMTDLAGLDSAAKFYGASIAPGGLWDKLSPLWRAVVFNSRTKIREDDLVRLLATEFVDEDKWDKMLTYLGYLLPEERGYIREFRHAIPDLQTLFQLANRKLITPDDYTKYLSAVGFWPDRLGPLVNELRYFLPGPSDLISFMLRDVADEAVVAKYGYDEEFGDKFKGLLKDFATWQGVKPEVMRLYWRAHWQLPSPTQAYIMLQRLRPGRVPGVKPVEIGDVVELLKINDMAPGWVDRLAAISYNTLTRVDVRRAYFIGVIGEQEVYEQNRDGGYDDRNARILVEFTKREKKKYLQGLAGLIGPKQAASLFEQYLIEEPTFRSILADNELPDDIIEEAVRDVRIKRVAKLRQKCIASLHKRFLTGEWDYHQAIEAVQAQGFSNESATEMVAQWVCELTARSKIATASLMCNWFDKGLITAVEFQLRLIRAGWQATDAARTVAVCQINLAEKVAKEKLKRLKEQKAAADKLERELKKKLEAEEKFLRHQASRLESLGGRLDKLNIRRAELLGTIGGDGAKLATVDADIALTERQLEDVGSESPPE